ncbi:TonB-dependent receptor [Ideonella sp.]|uniref:TonB-dependent receptor n=1 Tax=Ideonella sp. TaxID=1929293 RepID=UPI002B4832F4|nr:TonB-dependent receptor [Ideonella sp.]HJV68168.1 TonB-dependent receptor [Ideonella sp.]
MPDSVPRGAARAPALRRATLPLAALSALSLAPAAHAQGVATDAQLQTVTVAATAARSGLARNVPSSSASKTAEELREQNLFNPEDALKYVPNTTIRKRYAGDRNALIGGRSFGPLQPSRGLAYVDGYLISNFLGRFDGPRWNMVTPEAIARVDVLYGPFSAIYPGNSIGTTVAITEREPRDFEASARLTGYTQHFDLYGQSGDYDGHQASAYLGARFDGGLWAALSLNHQDSTSQPMQYYTVGADAATGEFAVVTPPNGVTPTRVTGIAYDTDPKGVRRAVFGASGGAIDHTRQDTAKLKLGYRFGPALEAQAMLGGWRNDSDIRNAPFLRDGDGRTVWSGYVTDGDHTFDIPATAFAPSTRNESHLHGGLTLKTRHATGWNGSLVYSNYRIVDDLARQALAPDPVAAAGGAGTLTRRDSTGWNTLELQAAYLPTPGDFGGGRHTLTFGAHRNGYRLDSPTWVTTDWRDEDTATTLDQRYRGRTEVEALYAQDAWALGDDLSLTLGLRHERFRAYDGEQLARIPAGTACVPGDTAVCVPNPDGSKNKLAAYGERRLSGASPKASLAWTLTDDWLLKLSAGRGLRFPNVEELYNGTVTASSESLSDPALRPERSDALELSAEKDWARHHLRVSLFHDDVRDAILRQSEVVGTRSVSRISNVDRVRTYGVELAWQAQDWGLRGLSVDANLAWADSTVVANSKDPAMVGKAWLRVPRVRTNLLAAYRPAPRWMASVGVRHSGRAYNDTYNLDTHPDVYGGVSSFTFVDLRGSYQIHPHVELALGIDNVADARGYQAHPYPGRTVFTELRVWK